ncbi:MAG: WecB/TagA/CpsF family glycosyltransferase [Eubacterium sp.]|nr:WecB/TagA/CpsF family glycosyltransferase [Eubacterium sp.]
MTDQIQIGQFHIDYLELDQILIRLEEMLQNDYLNTVALLTRHLLLDASVSEEKEDYLKRIDLGIIDEVQLLEAADIHEGRVLEEVSDRIVMDRVFWQFVKRGLSVYLLSDSEQGGAQLKGFLTDRYPGIKIVGETRKAPASQAETDRLLNAVNGLFPDLIISGLDGSQQDAFMVQHQTKVVGKIWWSFSESPFLQEASGIRRGFLESWRMERAFRKTFT